MASLALRLTVCATDMSLSFGAKNKIGRAPTRPLPPWGPVAWAAPGARGLSPAGIDFYAVGAAQVVARTLSRATSGLTFLFVGRVGSVAISAQGGWVGPPFRRFLARPSWALVFLVCCLSPGDQF